MFFRKAFCVIAILLLITLPCIFARSLLYDSLSSASIDELRAMASSFGLDSTGAEDAVFKRILDYFGLDEVEEPLETVHETALETEGQDSTGTALESSPNAVADSKTTTSITIESADMMFTLGDVVVMSGNIRLSFSDSSGSKKTLTADKVVVDLGLKAVEASGNVVLEDENDDSKQFSGKSVYFDWDSMDVVVFNGISSTERKNAAGTNVSLYASGQTISYAGEQNIAFFNDGVISTAQEDPYWSINASKVSFSGSDVFVDGALVKLGRVPIMYFPFFFYPGTTLAFNPAIGLSSDKGAFINTTTELYGVYPKIGASSGSSSSSSSNSSSDSNDADLSASLLSLLDSGDSSEKVRDGLYYRSLETGEQLGALESWARRTKSYFAFFADAYEDLGLIAGYDTSNSLWDGILTVSSVGAIGYNANESSYANRTRYYVDLNLKLKYKDASLSISAPYFSDYLAKSDFLNRNTKFGLDAVFGSNQEFPSTYSSQKEYSWTVDASASAKLGQASFRLSSLKAQIDYEFDRSTVDGKYAYTPKVKSATLPDLSFSSNASWTVLKSSKTAANSTLSYDDPFARSLEQERTSLEEETAIDADSIEETAIEEDAHEEDAIETDAIEEEVIASNESKSLESKSLDLSFYKAPSISSSSSSSSSGNLKFGYTFNQTFRNKYTGEMVPSSLYSKTYGTVYIDGSSPDSWIAVKETLKPQYSFTSDVSTKRDESLSYKNVHDFSFVSNLVVQSQPLGLTYRLSNKIYSLNSKDVDGVLSNDESGWGEWKKGDVTEHSIEFRKVLGSFSLGLKSTLKPVKETLKPSVSFSQRGFTASMDISFEETDAGFEKSLGNLGFGYSNSFLSLSFKNAYNFNKYDGVDFLSAYSFSQNGSLKFFGGSLSLSESLSYKENLKPSSLSFSLRGSKDFTSFTSSGLCSFSLKGNDDEWEWDVLKVKVDNKLNPVYFWKHRIGLELSLNADFTYSFANPYATVLSFDFRMEFAVAQFLSFKLGVKSSNRSFYRYIVDGSFNFDSMLEDLIRSFDFFGDGRKSTGFNMSSFNVELVHYMRDWDLCMSVEGSLKAQSSGKLAWSPVYKVYVKWNAIPELKVEKTVDTSKEV